MPGRICAVRKSKEAAERAKSKAIRESTKKGFKTKPETIESAEYIFVFTTLNANISASTILEMYRGRWQIELVFKRLKSILGLGHLKKVDLGGARSWIHGKLEPANFNTRKVEYKQFSEEEKREIIFKDITSGETNHITYLESNAVTDYRSVIGYFTQGIMKELRLISGYDLLYPKVRQFIADHLFNTPVNIDDLNTLRNLSEPGAA